MGAISWPFAAEQIEENCRDEEQQRASLPDHIGGDKKVLPGDVGQARLFWSPERKGSTLFA